MVKRQYKYSRGLHLTWPLKILPDQPNGLEQTWMKCRTIKKVAQANRSSYRDWVVIKVSLHNRKHQIGRDWKLRHLPPYTLNPKLTVSQSSYPWALRPKEARHQGMRRVSQALSSRLLPATHNKASLIYLQPCQIQSHQEKELEVWWESQGQEAWCNKNKTQAKLQKREPFLSTKMVSLFKKKN